MKGNRELHDYAGMNPEAANVMGWPDKDKAILVDEHQPQKIEVKDVVHEVVEVEEMKQGETYHDAHLDALKAETTVKTPQQLVEKVEAIRDKKEVWQQTKPEYTKDVIERAKSLRTGYDEKHLHSVSKKEIKHIQDKGAEEAHRFFIENAIKEGKTIPPEVLKDYPYLTTQGGQEVSRSAQNAEKAGSIPAPATEPPEQPEREGHPISEAENRAIHAWYGEHGESNHGGKHMGVLTIKQRNNLPDSAFAIPEERKYPIHDKNHARAALARVAEFGTPEEKERVRKAIANRYPEKETLNSYATAKAGGHKIMMTPLKDSPHHPVTPKRKQGINEQCYTSPY